MELSIKKLNQIKNKIRLDIGKITLVTGYNGIGKSTISKILYCFLKANSVNRSEPAIKTVNNEIINLYHKISRYEPIEYEKHDPYNDDEWFYINQYLEFKEEFIEGNKKAYDEYYCEDFELIDQLIKIVSEDGFELHISLLRTLLKRMFNSTVFEFEAELNNDDEHYSLDLSGKDLYSDDILEYNKGFVFNNVYYIEQGTLLDYIDNSGGVYGMDNFEVLSDKLKTDNSGGLFDDEYYKTVKKFEEELVELIGGFFEYDRFGKLIFRTVDDVTMDLVNVSNSARSLGVLYLLLHNRQLDKGDFIIFENIENNLHPESQLKLADWLCRCIRDLDIHFYINTFSALFIEAVEVLSVKYGIEDYTEYVLLDYNCNGEVKSHNYNRHNLVNFYNNLGMAYDTIDSIRLSNVFDK